MNEPSQASTSYTKYEVSSLVDVQIAQILLLILSSMSQGLSLGPSLVGDKLESIDLKDA